MTRQIKSNTRKLIETNNTKQIQKLVKTKSTKKKITNLLASKSKKLEQQQFKQLQ